ncbi:hypothetical protein Ddye_021498 [Dipteronia dyeriana]|uniref:Uncharacterized protein n=1 Tax=Dipteronia dyeriana TaxID=168575 RepID=A0AAD9U274_9ROSI|nr:hypothetical protein Ddye_021498 [Dipteronia dyeriana]
MTTCIIMHHMIVEDENDVDASTVDHMEMLTLEVEMMVDENTPLQEFLTRHRKVKDKDADIAL